MLAPMNRLSTQHSPPFPKEITQQLLDSRRVAIIGNQGAGKTTLANKLAKIIGIEYVQVPWKSKRMTPPEIEEIKRQMAKRENWIVDGDFGLLDMAETIIHLDFPLPLCLWRATTRSIKNFLRWDFRAMNVFAVIPGRITQLLRILSEVYVYPSQAGSKPPRQPASRSFKTMITLKSPKDLELFLSAIEVPPHPCRPPAESRTTLV
jgi:energy-coupling factor transporter ATP-binding protein EcfA2